MYCVSMLLYSNVSILLYHNRRNGVRIHFSCKRPKGVRLNYDVYISLYTTGLKIGTQTISKIRGRNNK